MYVNICINKKPIKIMLNDDLLDKIIKIILVDDEKENSLKNYYNICLVSKQFLLCCVVLCCVVLCCVVLCCVVLCCVVF